MNKKERLQVIQDLVVRFSIDTQEEIVERLRDMGIHATQATVSRDIKELGIIKIPSADKGYIYGLPKSTLGSAWTINLLEIESMERMIHIKVVPGTSIAVKRQLSDRFSSLIFSMIADDDSLLLVMREEAFVSQLIEKIRTW